MSSDAHRSAQSAIPTLPLPWLVLAVNAMGTVLGVEVDPGDVDAVGGVGMAFEPIRVSGSHGVARW